MKIPRINPRFFLQSLFSYFNCLLFSTNMNIEPSASKQNIKPNIVPTMSRGLNLRILFLHDDMTYPKLIMDDDSISIYVDETRTLATSGIAINKNGLSIPPITKMHKTKLPMNQGMEMNL